MNLAELVEPHDADNVALVAQGRSVDYGELRGRADRIRAGLVAAGLEPGDRVALVCASTPTFVATFLGVIGAGLIAVPINPRSPGPELQAQFAAVDPRAIVVGPAGRKGFVDVDRYELPSLEMVLVPEGVDLNGALPLDGLDGPPTPIVERGDDDLAVLLFTSGTAGSSKPAMLTHGNLLSNLEQLERHPEVDPRPEDAVLGIIPFSHIFGLNNVLLSSIRAGSRVVLVERFDPATLVEVIGTEGISLVTGPPTLWSALVQVPDIGPEHFASVRRASSGASKLPVAMHRQVQERFGLHIFEGYGLTEAAPTLAVATRESPPGTVGPPLPGVEMRLVDDEGDDVFVGDEGEIWVRGPNVFPGYWNEPEATARALTPDGWLRTGDVAVVDDHGNLEIVDRRKDLIVVSGFNVYPAEVDAVLASHPGVADCAVAGIPHPHHGEAVKAFVVPTKGSAIEVDDLIAHCEARMAHYKCPVSVAFVDQLPRGDNGKIRRGELVEAALSAPR